MTHQRLDYQYEANSYVENKHGSLNISTWELIRLCAGYLDLRKYNDSWLLRIRYSLANMSNNSSSP